MLRRQEKIMANFKRIGVTALSLALALATPAMARDGDGDAGFHSGRGAGFHSHGSGRGGRLAGGLIAGRARGYGYYAGGYYPADYYSDHYYPNRGYYVDYDQGEPYPYAVASSLAAVSGYCARPYRFVQPGSGPYFVYYRLTRPCE
jgi:hypothetical protein